MLQTRDFRLLWWSTLASSLGNGVTFVALPLLATTVSDRPWAAAGITAATYLAGMLCALPAGAWADRTPPRTVLVATDAVRAAVLVALALAVLLGAAPLALIWAAAFVSAAMLAAFTASARSMLPRVVDHDSLPVANGRLETATTVGLQAVGPVAGGLLFAVAGWLPLVVDAVSYAASGALLYALSSHASRTAADQGQARTLADVAVGGMRALFGDMLLRWMMVCVVALAAAQAGLFAVLAPYAAQVLSLGPVGFGLLCAAPCAGGFAGGYACRWIDRAGPGAALAYATSLTAAAYALLGFFPGLVAASAALSLETGAVVIGMSAVHATYQRRVSPSRVGSAVAALRLTATAAAAAGAVLAGVAAALVGPDGLLRWSAAAILLLCAATARPLWAHGGPEPRGKHRLRPASCVPAQRLPGSSERVPAL